MCTWSTKVCFLTDIRSIIRKASGLKLTWAPLATPEMRTISEALVQRINGWQVLLYGKRTGPDVKSLLASDTPGYLRFVELGGVAYAAGLQAQALTKADEVIAAIIDKWWANLAALRFVAVLLRRAVAGAAQGPLREHATSRRDATRVAEKRALRPS